MKIRVLRLVYYEGEKEWIDRTLQRSIQGEIIMPRGRISAQTLAYYPVPVTEDEKDVSDAL